MDDRQRQITEGAGLEESRLNTELLDWLNRWGDKILLAVLIVALAFVGWNWWERRQVQVLDDAFFELNAAIESGSPDALIAVAEQYPDRAAVAEQALLAAADAHLRAATVGLDPAAEPQEDGAFAEEDMLDEAQRREHASTARDLYEQVGAGLDADTARVLLRLRAGSGVASASITLGEYEQARAALQDLIAQAREAGYSGLADQAEARLGRLEATRNPPPLVPREKIAIAPEEPAEPDRSSLRLDEPIPLNPAEPSGEGEQEGSGFGDFVLPPPTGEDDEPASAPQPGEGEESPGEATPDEAPEETPPPGS